MVTHFGYAVQELRCFPRSPAQTATARLSSAPSRAKVSCHALAFNCSSQEAKSPVFEALNHMCSNSDSLACCLSLHVWVKLCTSILTVLTFQVGLSAGSQEKVAGVLHLFVCMESITSSHGACACFTCGQRHDLAMLGLHCARKCTYVKRLDCMRKKPLEGCPPLLVPLS